MFINGAAKLTHIGGTKFCDCANTERICASCSWPGRAPPPYAGPATARDARCYDKIAVSYTHLRAHET
eukprot:3763747-Lingulodinium_polyedra.AAC.1